MTGDYDVNDIVTKEDCSPAAWRLIEHFTRTNQELRNELQATHKRLCQYEGHLPIHDVLGFVWCDECGEPILAKATLRQRLVRWLARRSA